MTLWGINPTDGDDSDLMYARHICDVRRIVRIRVRELSSVKATDNGFMASVQALRVLAEGIPEIGKHTLYKEEVAEWETWYLAWLEKMRRKFPKAIDPDAVKNRSLEEFSRLKELAKDYPRFLWEEEVQRALKQNETSTPIPSPASVSSQSAAPTCSWGACDFVEHPDEPRYALTFDRFEKWESEFEEHGLSGGGRAWGGILQALLQVHEPEILPKLSFDCESSMFCVRSSEEEALDSVAAWIHRALADRTVFEEGLRTADKKTLE